MVKLERVTEAEKADASAIEIPVPPTALTAASLSFELAKGKGTATFRSPLLSDLIAIERKGVNITTQDGFIALCRQTAQACCTQWGAAAAMPPSDQIRSSDDTALTVLFAGCFKGLTDDLAVAEFVKTLDGHSMRHEGFDSYEVTLESGDRIRFDEPTQKDVQAKEKVKGFSEGMLRMAASLCTHWNDEPIAWTQSLLRLQKLSVTDFLRVANALNTFPG